VGNIVLGGGCFWCLEAIFEQVKGVLKVTPGYAGGECEKPTYEMVCSKNTGHAEVVNIDYNKSIIKMDMLLEIFFAIHNPTTINQQGNDIGPQYRSIILTNSESEIELCKKKMKEIEEENLWENELVTEVFLLEKFWPAEDYHWGYFRKNPNQGYCAAVVNPKLSKFRKQFAELIY